MAYQGHKKAEGAQIVRTPAPTAVDNIRNPKGQGYGTNGPQPSSVAPGHAVESALGANLRESSDDGEGVLSKVIGGALRADNAGPVADEEREVTAKGYSPTHGAKSNQAPLASIGKNSLPDKLGASAALDDSQARRAAELKG